jgi:(R,R)-butanediol dehydrogenase/meso-butanediol dehydrogenase/diacetyl reductase
MKALILRRPGEVAVARRPAPEPRGAALVRVRRAGVCGTDLAVAAGQVPTARLPLILGHELTGQVEVPAPGSAIPAGARVVVDPAQSCGTCEVCRQDLPHLCPHGGLMGRDTDGGFAELVAVPASRLHPLPDAVTDDDAVLVQVLSTCVHALDRVRLGLGQSGLVVGLGTTGLLHVRLLAAQGVSPVIGISRSAAKRALAQKLGATVTGTPAQALELVGDLTRGRGAGIAVECAGQPEALVQAMTAAAFGGTVLMFGTIHSSPGGLPVYDWYRKELTLVGTRAARPRDLTAAIQVIRDGLVRPSELVTSVYPLDAGPEALIAAAQPGQVKVVMAVSEPAAPAAAAGAPSRPPGQAHGPPAPASSGRNFPTSS